MGKLSWSMKLLALATTIQALQLPRRALPIAAGVALAPALAPSRTHAAAEWAVGALQDKAWTISKRQESSVRIRPQALLRAVAILLDSIRRRVFGGVGRLGF